ncbi:MAG: LuxR C-terminal-related transcriptional regulator, partial [Salinisphaera sp.]|nr:LuxR C-terminal-related transcriptional regulator [Salinisphaera sp.]
AFRSPPGLHLVLAGTGEPPVNLARARLEGGLREIGVEELRLRASAVRELFGAQLSAQLDEADIEQVLALTEGWPAAVRLLQIILAAAPQPRAALGEFSGTDRDVANLLQQQVLDTFDRELGRFLVSLSLLDRFSAPLCRHAFGEGRADEFLDQLLEANALILPLDRHRNWYRLHGLLRDFLLGEAERLIDAGQRQRIRERAARWSEQEGHWAEAVDYALTSPSGDLAVDMLERVAPFFVRERGDLDQYVRWAQALKATGAELGWEAHFWYVWALVFHRRYEAARQQLERLVQRAESDSKRPGIAEFQRRIDLLGIIIDVYTDHLGGAAAERVSVWLKNATGDDPFDVSTLAVASALHCTAFLDLVGARRRVQQAQSFIAQADSVYGKTWVAVISAMLAAQEGEYPRAFHQLDSALGEARVHLGDKAGVVGTVAAVAAKCAVEMNHGDQARQLADLGVSRLDVHGVSDTAIYGLDAGIKLWRGADDGWLTLAALRELAAGYPPRVATALGCFLVRRYLRLGRVDDAVQEARAMGLKAWRKKNGLVPGAEFPRTRALLAITEADLAIARGHLKSAQAIVEQEQTTARRQGRWGDVVELALLQMSVCLCSHNPEPAARHFTRAVGSAAKRRILRPFKERADLIAGLVNETRVQSWGFASEEERRFFGEVCQGLPVANSSLLEELEEMESQAVQLRDTPTPRELELIRLIEAGLTNKQIAARVDLSVATVKWHLYNLYNKLGVSSRSAALARARALNLLSR